MAGLGHFGGLGSREHFTSLSDGTFSAMVLLMRTTGVDAYEYKYRGDSQHIKEDERTVGKEEGEGTAGEEGGRLRKSVYILLY